VGVEHIAQLLVYQNAAPEAVVRESREFAALLSQSRAR